MDQTALVSGFRSAGPALVERLTEAGYPISAAFWYWDVEAQEERLAIASPLVDEQGALAAYRQIGAVLQRHPEIAPLFFLARITAESPARLRDWLERGHGPFDRTRVINQTAWIEGGRPPSGSPGATDLSAVIRGIRAGPG
jgi:hypothetical protein